MGFLIGSQYLGDLSGASSVLANPTNNYNIKYNTFIPNGGPKSPSNINPNNPYIVSLNDTYQQLLKTDAYSLANGAIVPAELAAEVVYTDVPYSKTAGTIGGWIKSSSPIDLLTLKGPELGTKLTACNGGVCIDHALLTQYLAQQSDQQIQTVVVSSPKWGLGGHALNKVTIDGQDFALNPTWGIIGLQPWDEYLKSINAIQNYTISIFK